MSTKENIFGSIDGSKICPASSNFKSLRLACCTLRTLNVHGIHTHSSEPKSRNIPKSISRNLCKWPSVSCRILLSSTKNKHSVCNVDDPIDNGWVKDGWHKNTFCTNPFGGNNNWEKIQKALDYWEWSSLELSGGNLVVCQGEHSWSFSVNIYALHGINT